MTSDLSNKSYPDIWVLVDNRTGGANQALALASRLSPRHQVKNIEYNNFSSLPSFVLVSWPINIKRSVLNELKSQNPPDIIVSSGRRTAALAIYLKKRFNNKIKVVPEGVDVNTFFPEETSHELSSDGRFKFFLAGRWDYRKSIKEIIETFLNTFDKDEPVDLIVSVDNPFSNDGLKTTEERLEHYGFTDNRIKILHFPPREEYIKILKSCDAFVSCARAEGWNLPLIEAMACGTPSIYSNCSGQLEFAEG
ncbi:MAG: glycosyltransferase family 1 protein, partial [Alphaproteobacteria bacterium]|nr:glycosyltransferase family 1 protein [Alphaproteobacteria bacterium]